jgi:hypothetical protein
MNFTWFPCVHEVRSDDVDTLGDGKFPQPLKRVFHLTQRQINGTMEELM